MAAPSRFAGFSVLGILRGGFAFALLPLLVYYFFHRAIKHFVFGTLTLPRSVVGAGELFFCAEARL